jgi:hypothetical protein
MPWSDEERLDRVYRRAQSIRLLRRARFLAAALPLVVLAGALVAAAASPDDGRKLQVAGPVESTTTSLAPQPPDLTAPTITIIGGRPPTTHPPTTGTVKPPSTTSTTELFNCGGASPGSARPKAPEGLRITTEASKPVVRRGDDVVLTLRVKWTGSQPLTYSRTGQSHMILGTYKGMIHYSTQYDDEAQGQTGQDTFQPGEEKTFSVTWDTSLSCGPNGFRPATLPTGTYVIEGTWDSDQPNWVAEPGQFELVD